MMEDNYQGLERRQFLRFEYVIPLAYKVCKAETISKILQGYTSNISQAGVLCKIKDRVNQGDILWLSFEREILNICEELEKRSFIYQNGVIGKVVRVDYKEDNTYDVGVQFLTREEENQTHIYPQIYFLKRRLEESQKKP